MRCQTSEPSAMSAYPAMDLLHSFWISSCHRRRSMEPVKMHQTELMEVKVELPKRLLRHPLRADVGEPSLETSELLIVMGHSSVCIVVECSRLVVQSWPSDSTYPFKISSVT